MSAVRDRLSRQDCHFLEPPEEVARREANLLPLLGGVSLSAVRYVVLMPGGHVALQRTEDDVRLLDAEGERKIDGPHHVVRHDARLTAGQLNAPAGSGYRPIANPARSEAVWLAQRGPTADTVSPWRTRRLRKVSG